MMFFNHFFPLIYTVNPTIATVFTIPKLYPKTAIPTKNGNIYLYIPFIKKSIYNI